MKVRIGFIFRFIPVVVIVSDFIKDKVLKSPQAGAICAKKPFLPPFVVIGNGRYTKEHIKETLIHELRHAEQFMLVPEVSIHRLTMEIDAIVRGLKVIPSEFFEKLKEYGEYYADECGVGDPRLVSQLIAEEMAKVTEKEMKKRARKTRIKNALKKLIFWKRS